MLFIVSKFSNEEKLEIIRSYLNGHKGYKTLSSQYSVTPGVIEMWVAKYREHGVQGLIPQRRYSGQFKQYVVEYMKSQHLSYRQTAAKFAIQSHRTVIEWEKLYEKYGLAGLMQDKRGRSRMTTTKKRKNKPELTNEQRLLEENEELRMENEYLKNLIALTQGREVTYEKQK